MRGRAALLCGAGVGVSGALLTCYAAAMAERLGEDEAARRGRFAAAQLAASARYGVLTEDAQLLQHLTDWTLSSSESDVVGVVIRDLKGSVLAGAWRRGHSASSLPGVAREAKRQKAASARDGELDVFSAPVMGPDNEWLGGIDVALSGAQIPLLRMVVLARLFSLTAVLSLLAAAMTWILVREPSSRAHDHVAG